MAEISQKKKKKSLGNHYFGIYTSKKQEQKTQKKFMAQRKGGDLDNLFTISF